MAKFNTLTLSRKDFSIIGVSYDTTIPDRGDYRDEVARVFFNKMKRDGFNPTEKVEDKPKKEVDS